MQLGITFNGKGALFDNSGTPVFSETYDVIVVGLGTAGAEAFRHCAALGMKVLGVEKHNGMGGMGTIGCVAFGKPVTALMKELEANTRQGKIQYETVAAGVWVENHKIMGLRLQTNGVVKDVGAGIVIDATGNATIPRMCGLPLRKGRDYDGVMAPCARGETWRNLERGNIHPLYRNYPIDLSLTALDYSDAVLKLAVERHKNWLSNRKNERLLKPSMIMGAREEPRAVTEQIVTLQETLEEKQFPDPIFYAWEPEDLPVYHGDHAFESEPIQNWKVLCGLPLFGYPAVLPYGTIVAKDIDGLLVPSKHFGVAHDLGGGIRMQTEMRQSGVAAACAAFVALRKGCPLKDVPYAELKPLLERAGNLRKPAKTYVNSVRGMNYTPFTDEQVIQALKQDMTRTTEWWFAEAKGDPNELAVFALWTAWKRRMNANADEAQALADKLAREMIQNKRFAANFAVALGLMNDSRAIPVLLEVIRHPGGEYDPVIPKAYPNRIKALLLLGRFQEKAALPTMMAILKDDAESFMKDLFDKSAFSSQSACRFQALSYTLTSLRNILEKHPDSTLRQEILEWQQHDFTIIATNGDDLTSRLRHVF